jgi:hypothetical protein
MVTILAVLDPDRVACSPGSTGSARPQHAQAPVVSFHQPLGGKPRSGEVFLLENIPSIDLFPTSTYIRPNSGYGLKLLVHLEHTELRLIARTHAAPAPLSSLRRVLSVVGAVLIASGFGVPTASAGLAGKAADTVGSVVAPVTETPLPPRPSVPPPPVKAPVTPPVSTPAPPPVKVPTAPRPPAKAPSAPPVKVPTAPRPPAKAPSAPPVKVPTAPRPAGTSPTPRAPAQTSPAPKAPSVGGPGAKPRVPGVPAPSSGSTQSAGSGVQPPSANTVNETASVPKGSVVRDPSTAPTPGTAPAPGAVGGDPGGYGAATPGGEAASLQSATVAPLPRLLAYVWPAIALGPVGELLASLQARFEAASLLPVSVFDVSRVLGGLSAALEEAGVGGAAALSNQSAVSDPPPADPKGIWVPDGAEISLLVLIASCAALMGLLAYAIRRELHSRMHRRPF